MSNSLCSLKSCVNKQSSLISLFKIPKSIITRQKWLEFLLENGNKSVKENATYRLCEDHFQPNQIILMDGKKRLSKDSIPSNGLNNNLVRCFLF